MVFRVFSSDTGYPLLIYKLIIMYEDNKYYNIQL
nr:MAG TPA: hypothetical protein [Caudoviricetes sp.]